MIIFVDSAVLMKQIHKFPQFKLNFNEIWRKIIRIKNVAFHMRWKLRKFRNIYDSLFQLFTPVFIIGYDNMK